MISNKEKFCHNLETSINKQLLRVKNINLQPNLILIQFIKTKKAEVLIQLFSCMISLNKTAPSAAINQDLAGGVNPARTLTSCWFIMSSNGCYASSTLKVFFH